MVRGAVVTVTPVPGANQCAETHSTALGRTRRFPSAAQASVSRIVQQCVHGIAMADKEGRQRVDHKIPPHGKMTRAGRARPQFRWSLVTKGNSLFGVLRGLILG